MRPNKTETSPNQLYLDRHGILWKGAPQMFVDVCNDSYYELVIIGTSKVSTSIAQHARQCKQIRSCVYASFNDHHCHLCTVKFVGTNQSVKSIIPWTVQAGWFSRERQLIEANFITCKLNPDRAIDYFENCVINTGERDPCSGHLSRWIFLIVLFLIDGFVSTIFVLSSRRSCLETAYPLICQNYSD